MEALAAVRSALAIVVAWVAVNAINAGVQFAIGVAVVTAWGVFLAVLATGEVGMGIFSIFNQNPLTGMYGSTYQLFCSVFPFQFFCRLVVAYILWNLTFQHAAVLMSRTIRFFFGG
jgi:hypothetical protein